MIPLVSICIPTYNGQDFLSEAMESAIKQTYSRLEIIVSDDASIDNTINIIKQYQQKTNIPITIFNHQPNGIGANWNNCIRKANGEYIKFLFQDDIIEATCVEKMVEVLKNDTSLGLVACKRNFIIAENYISSELKVWIEQYGDLQEHLKLPEKKGLCYLDKSLFKSPLFLNHPLNKVGEPSVILFKKELANEIGFFREDLKQILDFEFYYRVLKKHRIAIIKESLASFRLHSKQATNQNKGTGQIDQIKYLKILFKEYFWLLSARNKFLIFKKYLYFKILFLKETKMLQKGLMKLYNSYLWYN